MNTKRGFFGWMMGFILVAGSFSYFRFVTPYHICFKEQIQLFVFQTSYILSYFNKPAALACLFGDFLTQFFYFKSGGAAVIALLLLVEWGVIWWVLWRGWGRLGGQWGQWGQWRIFCYWALLPVIVEWVAFPRLTFSVSLSVSFILSLFAFIIYSFTNRKIAFITGIILIPLLYALAGASVFLFVFLAALFDLQRKTTIHRYLLQTAIFVALSSALPFIFRHYYLLTLRQAYLYPYPDFIHGLSLVVLAVIGCFLLGKWRTFPRLSLVIVFSVLLIALLYKTTDRNRESLLGMMTEAYHNQWDKVLDIAEKAELKTSVAAHYVNMALSQKNLLGERLMDFYQPFSTGLLLTNTAYSGWLEIFASSDGYFHVGDMELAQHAALIGMLFSPNQRSARLLERLVEINRITGDLRVAMKYTRMLNTTLFHGVEAEEDREDNEDREAGEIGEDGSYPFEGGRGKLDILRKANDIKISLEQLAINNPKNLPAVNYLLCYYLLNKDIPAFFKAYTSYFKDTVYPVPKVYAEALLIYFAATQSPVKEMMAYNVHPDIIRQFTDYTQLYESAKGQLAPLQAKYAKTYWLYYHFAVMNKETINN